MNISENKRVVGLSAVFALAFAGVAYYGYSETVRFDAAKKQLTEISNQFEDYEAAAVPPTKKNRDSLKAAFAQVNQVNKELQAELNHYATFCYGDGKNITGPNLQEELRNAKVQMEQLAKEKGMTLSGTAADLGMASILRAFPEDSQAPYYAFQHRAVRRVAEDIINAGAPVLDKIYCAPLSEDVTAANKKSAKAQPYFPLRFEVAFDVKRGVLPKVINSIVADKDFLISITGISVQGMDNLAPLDAYSAPSAAPTAGDDLSDAPAAESAPAAGRAVAVRKTGDPNETARVHMNLQVLYFNPAKTK